MSAQPANIVIPKSSTDSEASNHQRGTILEKILHINIRNSLGNLALAGPNGGNWTLVDGTQQQVLGCTSEKDSATAINQLSHAIIHSATLISDKNEFPVALGVQLNCIPSREYTELGESYAYTALPKSSTTTPHVLFQAETMGEEMVDWHKEYPKFTAANLESEGVMPVNNQSVVFIDHMHPVVGVLRNNQKLIGVDIDSMKKIDNTWYKITRQVLGVCCDAIRTKILNKMQTHDLNTLSVQIHRLHANGWEDLGDGTIAMQDFKLKSGLSEEQIDAAKREHLRKFTSTHHSYMARIHLKYELPSVA